MKRIFAICGSTRSESANLKLLKIIEQWATGTYHFEIYNELAGLPHFNPDLDKDNPPEQVLDFRRKISAADALLICTPEYVFSLPGSLKNALEWLVSTTLLDGKPGGIITASAGGEKGQEQLAMLLRVLSANVPEKTQLLISGVKGKFDAEGRLKDTGTRERLGAFWSEFEQLLR